MSLCARYLAERLGSSADGEGNEEGNEARSRRSKSNGVVERVEVVEKRAAGFPLDLVNFCIVALVMLGPWIMDPLSVLANDGPHVPPCAPMRGGTEVTIGPELIEPVGEWETATSSCGDA